MKYFYENIRVRLPFGSLVRWLEFHVREPSCPLTRTVGCQCYEKAGKERGGWVDVGGVERGG